MQIAVSSEGAEVITAIGSTCSVSWADVTAISVAFVDLKTGWETIIAFDFSSGEFVEMNSSFENFGQLVQQIAITFGLKSQWLESVQEEKAVGTAFLVWQISN